MTDSWQVTDVELKMAKVVMDHAFVANQLKPGDPGFEYDKQVGSGFHG
jgi:centrosomal protein CEP19